MVTAISQGCQPGSQCEDRRLGWETSVQGERRNRFQNEDLIRPFFADFLGLLCAEKLQVRLDLWSWADCLRSIGAERHPRKD